MTERGCDRRTKDRLVSLDRLCDFFIDEKKHNPHSEVAWNELRDELTYLRSTNYLIMAELNKLKGEKGE